jgi:hypothetical protein
VECLCGSLMNLVTLLIIILVVVLLVVLLRGVL